jgi:hypothetical protein
LPLAIFLLCFIALLFRQLLRGKLAPILKRIIIFYCLIVVFGIISLLFNKVAVFPVVFSGIGLIAYFIYSLVINNKEYRLTQDQLFEAIIKIGILETVAAVFERVIFVWALHINSSDMVAGTFSEDGQFTFYQLFCIIIVLVYWFFDRPILKSVSNFWLLFIFFISIAVSGNSASLVFLPIIFLSVFVYVNKRQFLLKFRMVLIIIASLALMSYVYARLNDSDDSTQKSSNDVMTLLSDPNRLQTLFFGVEYDPGSILSKNGSLKRGSALVFGYELIDKSITNLILGKGPGTTSESQVPGAEGVIDKEYPGYKVNRTSYSQTIAELGIGGLVFIAFFLILVYFWKSYPNQPNEFLIIRKVGAILLLLYFAYENLFSDLIFGLVLSSITFIPQLNDATEISKKPATSKKLQSSLPNSL